MKRLRAFLASKYGKQAEHYAAIFAAAAATSLLASSQNFGGIHGVHALAAFLVGAGSVALKAGYDALRSTLLPAALGWVKSRLSHKPAPPAPPAPPVK